MTALTAFYDLVLPELSRCQPDFALQYIRLAVQEFYARALLHRVTLADVTTAEGTAEYALTLPDGYVLAKALRVWLDGEEIEPTSADEASSDTSTPTHYYLPSTASIAFVLTPDGVYTASVEAALKPDSESTTLHDWVYETWRDEIASGAKAKLMAQPGKPWTNNLAAYHSTRFEDAISRARHAVDSGHGRAPKRVRSVFGLR